MRSVRRFEQIVGANDRSPLQCFLTPIAPSTSNWGILKENPSNGRQHLVKYDRNKHHRRSIRLKGYDYSQAGAYFITICTHQRECLFGAIANSVMELNDYGQILSEEWMRSSQIRQEIELDAWVVMPNHFHGLVIIRQIEKSTRNVRANGRSPLPGVAPPMKPRSLSSLIAGFKSVVTKRINIARNTPETPVWQPNYYEHIIRDESSLQQIRQYILTNPQSWELDQLHPNNPSKW